MAENVFEAVKQSVSTREAAEFYGIKVSRTGMACCPFHDDKNPSMKVDQRFHCFGCGADGDVIDFTAKLFDLSPKEAAEKLAQDFGLIYDSQAPPRRRYVRQKTEAQKFREDRQRCYRVLSDYYYLLKKWEADRSPRTPEEEPHPRFVEAIQKKTYVEYLLDLFLYESEEEQKAWIAEHTAEITHLERRLKIMAENKPTNRERLREITDGIEQGIKELFESEKYMRYLSVMSRFHRYSVNNTMLIYMQKPDATLVAGYNKWKDQFERHVKKGEHGITIIAPTPYKKKIEEQKLDPDTKAPILDKDGKIKSTMIIPTGGGAMMSAEKSLEMAVEKAGIRKEDIVRIVTTGYGRAYIDSGDDSITEITCHAKGAHYLNPNVRTVIDIGGQDIKAISIDDNGAVKNFLMNDKCAAGTGRFLEMMARTLGLSLEEMSTRGLEWKENVVISSMCTVFAESEVVSLVAQNKDVADIIHGLNVSVASKVGALAARLGKKNPGEYMMTGGVARNKGIIQALEEKLGAKLYICDEAQLCGALGAALFAYEKCSV